MEPRIIQPQINPEPSDPSVQTPPLTAQTDPQPVQPVIDPTPTNITQPITPPIPSPNFGTPVLESPAPIIPTPQLTSPIVDNSALVNGGMTGAPSPNFETTPQIVSSSPTPLPTPKRKINTRLLLIFGIAFIIVAVVAAYFLIFNRPVTLSDIKTFNSNLSSFEASENSVQSDVNNALNESSLSKFNSDMSSATTDLTKAKQQFSSLEGSIVLHNSSVNKAFSEYKSANNALVNFASNELTDLNSGYFAQLISWGTQVTALSTSTSVANVTQLVTFMDQFKTSTTSVLAKISSTPQLTSQDQKLVNDAKTDLQNIVNSEITYMADITTSNVAAINTDSAKFTTALQAISDNMTTDTQAISSKFVSLGLAPGYSGSALDAAVSNLTATLTK